MRLRPTTVVFGVSLALLVAFCCLTANAQSGRRQAKPAPAAPVPSPTPEPTPSPTPKRNENDVNFLVASGDRGFSAAPLQYSDAAVTGCADELRKRTSAAVDVSRHDLGRGEAIDKAKASKTTYVVLVTLVEDRYSATNSGYVEFEIEYVVFAPGTAKVVANGRTYENKGAGKGPVSVGRRGSTLPTYREASFRRAGEEAADRILKSLHLDDLPKTNTTATADY
jgi:hypothetical protein